MKRIYEAPTPMRAVDAEQRELVDGVRAQRALEVVAMDGVPVVVVPREVTSRAAAQLSVLASFQTRG